jgi:lipoprotein-anchoring transpeptidase ErfK/SrfK
VKDRVDGRHASRDHCVAVDRARILVDLPSQVLLLTHGDALIRRYRVSTARNGPGEWRDSGCTPRGLHRIRIRIGAGCPEGTVFVGRRPTGEVYRPELAACFPDRDWILTRILWLSGMEPGRNRGGGVDTLRRYIYIHGCPETDPMGVPRSHGCIRMRNRDLMQLFDLVAPGTLVDIRGE